MSVAIQGATNDTTPHPQIHDNLGNVTISKQQNQSIKNHTDGPVTTANSSIILTTLSTLSTSIASVIPTSTLIPTTPVATTTNMTIDGEMDAGKSSFLVHSVLLPLAGVCFICLIAGAVLLIMRKNRLDKLRHHLMPVYNFDPSEDGEDWETELLDENIMNGPGFSNPNSNNNPGMPLGGLKLDTGLTGGLKIKPPAGRTSSNPNGPNSPTHSSGLLTGQTAGRLYTAERHQIV